MAQELAVLATTFGDFDEAESRFAAAATHERTGTPTWLARTQLEKARIPLTRRRPGDAERARRLGQALGTARELDLGKGRATNGRPPPMSTACSACGHENRQGQRFCTECGKALVLACPACKSPAERGERFCGQCGVPLDSIVPAAPEATRASLPPEAVLAGAGEKKQLTVLFADVQGSMDLQENLDPEVWAQIMGRFVAILAEGVLKFGGTVDKFTGDGIMALFGAPVAQEDHARRACHAAWHLTTAIATYGQELRASQGVDLHVRLGLNSGEVVVGRVGDDLRLDPTALGHAVGLAQRMEAMAPAGRAYLTEYTARLVEGWFRLEDLGPTTIKGAREPLCVYALAGPTAAPPILRAGRALGASRLVGRERELDVLEDALGAAAEGRAQVVGIVGEAGVGKSRLCEEFARSAADRGITVRRTTGVSHGRDVPLLPILALLRDYFRITEADIPDQARERVAERVLDLDPDLEDALPLLFDFLEVPDPAHAAPQLAPEVRMRRLLETISRVTQCRSGREVLVLLFEDLHWFDAQSAAFLERLIESFPGSRTLVLADFRPEFTASWMRHSYYRQLPLAPLREVAVGELLGGLLGADLSLAPLLGFVLERTGGNPFFVEEVVRALVEDGTLAGGPACYRLTRPLDQVRVPPTVQAVLAARIDRLPAEHKAVLQTAAVIGRTFSEPVLAKVTTLTGELEETLLALCAAELLQEVERRPVAEYRFWHPLTQEVAYGSLLTERRARLHAAVARAILELEPERLDERAALVATHFERADEHLEAARWNDRASGFALRSDVGEAMRRWRATLIHLNSAPETDEALGLGIRAHNRLIRYGARTGMGLDEAGRLYADARAMAERLQDPTQLASVTFAYGSTLFWRGASRDGLDRYLEAARLSDQTDDADAQAGYWTPPAFAFGWTGPVSAGLRAMERCLTLCGGDADVGVRVLGFSSLSALGVVRAQLLSLCGRVEDARAGLDEGLATARARAEAEWIAWNLSIYPRLACTPDEFEQSLERAHEAVHVAESCGNPTSHVLALGGVGIAEMGLGRFPEAAETLERALAAARQRQVGLFEEASLLLHLARARLGLGDGDGARSTASEAVEVARRQGAQVVECLALLTRARILRGTAGGAGDIDADLALALVLAQETEATAYEKEVEAERASLSAEQASTDRAGRARPQRASQG